MDVDRFLSHGGACDGNNVPDLVSNLKLFDSSDNDCS